MEHTTGASSTALRKVYLRLNMAGCNVERGIVQLVEDPSSSLPAQVAVRLRKAAPAEHLRQ